LPGHPELDLDLACSYLLPDDNPAVEGDDYEKNEDLCRDEIKPLPARGPIIAEFTCPNE